MISSSLFRQWEKEMIEVVETLDANKFRAFHKKWQERGFYNKNDVLPTEDEVIEIALRKMLYNLTPCSEEQKAEAKKWLQERGCNTTLYFGRT